MLDSKLIEKIRAGVIGEGRCIRTAFGDRPLIYADYTASGRALTFIEDFIRDKVLPYYANTHTEASFTGEQTSRLREQARACIHECVGGDDRHVVIFTGSGATAAINKLVNILDLRIPRNDRPIVFVGPYEHHSNELPWRESAADVVRIPLDEKGYICKAALVAALKVHADRNLKIGSFSAASNVTGIKSDVAGVSKLLHAHGALSFWDYAAAAPYCGINMVRDELDAVFVSPHKFIGGPGTPGVLVLDKALQTNAVPTVPGGGTVSWVSPDDHEYLSDPVHREEGGTPGIVESIRAGLVFQLQQQVGPQAIEAHEQALVRTALDRWSQHDNIQVLGSLTADRLAIVSLLIHHQDQPLHFGFVIALLNDLFGIQARGGCSCAGPYGHDLLGIGTDQSHAITSAVAQGYEILKPGWARLNFNYFFDEAVSEYLLSAVELIAEYGHRLLPYYETGTDGSWRYQGSRTEMPVNLDLFGGLSAGTEANEITLADAMRDASNWLQNPPATLTRFRYQLPEAYQHLCWFYTGEAPSRDPSELSIAER